MNESWTMATTCAVCVDFIFCSRASLCSLQTMFSRQSYVPPTLPSHQLWNLTVISSRLMRGMVLVWKHLQLILRRSHFYNWFRGLWMCTCSVWNRQCSFFICNCFCRRLLVRDELRFYYNSLSFSFLSHVLFLFFVKMRNSFGLINDIK